MATTRLGNSDGPGARLKWLRTNGPLAEFRTIRGMCEHLGIGKSTWYDWTNESYPPDGHFLEWLVGRGVSLDWLKTGNGEPFTSGTPTHASEPAQDRSGLLVEHQVARKGHDIPYVRWVDADVAAEEIIETTGDFFGFTDDELHAIRVDTTAMDGPCSDALRFGDTALNRPGGAPEENEIWVLRYLGENGVWGDVDIRRVILTDKGQVRLLPNNPLFDEIEKKSQEVSFLGKVEYRIAELHLGEAEISNGQWVHIDDPGVRQALAKLLDGPKGPQVLKDWAKLDDYGRLAVFGMIESLLKR